MEVGFLMVSGYGECAMIAKGVSVGGGIIL